MGIAINTVTNDGFTMDYIRFGTGERIFVILPGLSIKSVLGSADVIVNQYKMMADKYTIYLFDRRNEIPDTYTVRDMAADTAQAMMTLGIKGADIFGASQGGMMALVIAIEYPELVNKMVIGSSTADLKRHPSSVLEKWVQIAKTGDRVELSLSFGREIYPGEFFEKYEDAFEVLGKSVTDEELNRFITLAEGSSGFSVADDLHKIKCPVLAIAAADDNVIDPVSSEEMITAIGGDSKCFMYDQYGHAAFDMAPDYKQRMMEFLG